MTTLRSLLPKEVADAVDDLPRLYEGNYDFDGQSCCIIGAVGNVARRLERRPSCARFPSYESASIILADALHQDSPEVRQTAAAVARKFDRAELPQRRVTNWLDVEVVL